MGIHPSITDTPEVKELKKENERLRKEKEWLINEWVKNRYRPYGYPFLDVQKIKKNVLDGMQQALKE